MRHRSVQKVLGLAAGLGMLLAPSVSAHHATLAGLKLGRFHCEGNVDVAGTNKQIVTIQIASKKDYRGGGGKGKVAIRLGEDKLNFRTGPLKKYRLRGDGTTADWKLRKDQNGNKVADCILYVPND